jgi:hypothetical protein
MKKEVSSGNGCEILEARKKRRKLIPRARAPEAGPHHLSLPREQGVRIEHQIVSTKSLDDVLLGTPIEQCRRLADIVHHQPILRRLHCPEIHTGRPGMRHPARTSRSAEHRG